jgi:hypothetical protein
MTDTPLRPDSEPPETTPAPRDKAPAGDPATLLGAAAATAADATASDESVPNDSAPEAGAETAPGYEAFTLPDGMTLDAAALEAAQALFGEARLSQAQAQKFVDFALGRELAAQHRSLQAFQDLQERWVEEVKADPAIGGTKLNGALAHAARAIDRLGGSELRQALDLTGAGNHPAVVRAFVALGRLLAEDRFAPGASARPAPPRTPAETIYGSRPQGGRR